MDNDWQTSWHEGELSIQNKAGTAERMAEIGPKFIRKFMPQQHRDFFLGLSMIYIGYHDYNESVNASILFGAPGFIQSPNETELLINAQYSLGDFVIEQLTVGDRIGLLGIEFATKRRNRVNALIIEVNQKTIRLKVLQSFGNCPKYIQTKTFTRNRHYGEFTSTTSKQLQQADKHFILNADTFFIASYFSDSQQHSNRGADISHRGGLAGFVSISETNELWVDDYLGNGFFNTLGNLTINPIASLLFCDWRTGHVLRLTVSSEILWHTADQQDNHTDNTEKDSDNNNPQRSLCFKPLKIERFDNALAFKQIADA
ncbi:pyridoxamine 5'-phosphate oxidase family protein [Paraglaciecola aquimarina]|uniref:Pyridoxamine 5'-phosphate oxidase family protein n=1 Tax=Paraglaciecola aquimarina TaxID=1235557 RepID=A0ABU3SUK7_9ALTE|nr:pyridoxamine 5'-phosphate oxidase family protein [Paraglaciecola aquimarina]MDU0353706.1 pyridoxamine 5'-phosphate oxidase family protein [Paraglaciecola aquimarina]